MFVSAGPLVAQTPAQPTVPGAVQAVPDTGRGDTAGFTGNTGASAGSMHRGVDAKAAARVQAGSAASASSGGGSAALTGSTNGPAEIGGGASAQGRHDDASVTRTGPAMK